MKGNIKRPSFILFVLSAGVNLFFLFLYFYYILYKYMYMQYIYVTARVACASVSETVFTSFLFCVSVVSRWPTFAQQWQCHKTRTNKKQLLCVCVYWCTPTTPLVSLRIIHTRTHTERKIMATVDRSPLYFYGVFFIRSGTRVCVSSFVVISIKDQLSPSIYFGLLLQGSETS